MKRGVALEKVAALAEWKYSDQLDERERLVLEYAETVSTTNAAVSDELVAGLKTHFDNDGLVELTGLIAFQNMSSKFNSALAIPAQGFCTKLPPQK